MTNIDLQYAFELEAANIDNVTKDKLNSQDVLYWLNQGVDKFVKTRFDGDNSAQTSFEQNEKRARDLVNLLTTVQLDVSTFVSGVNCLKYTITYPTDFMFMLNESVDIYENTKPTTIIPTDVFQCTLDTYMSRITNSLSDFHMRNSSARPLRVRTATGCWLLTDGTYSISDFTITYIRKPNKILLDSPFAQYTDFPENVLKEIVKLAVGMYIENQKNSRYQTIENEINTME